MVYSEQEIERIVRVGFETARGRRKKLTSVDKSNVLASSRLWRSVASEVAGEYPDVELEHTLVDACAMLLITNPKDYDVIVTENMFGDILTDLAAEIQGGLGLAASGNINPNGVSMFEPVHGSAPDIAGKGLANPLGAILAARMMLDNLHRSDLGSEVDRGVLSAIELGILTPDMGGTATTSDVGNIVVEQIRRY